MFFTDLEVALLLQGVAALIVFGVVRGRWYRYTGALFLGVTLVFHGVTELVQRTFTGPSFYRLFASDRMIGEWLLLVSLSMLLFAVAYGFAFLSLGGSPRPGTSLALPLVDWKTALVVTAPVYAIAVVQTLPVSASPYLSGSTYWTTGITGTFLIFAVVLTSFAYIQKTGSGRLLRVMLIQSFALALLGQRSTAAIAFVMLLFVLSVFGIRIAGRTVIAGCLIVVVLSASISTARVLIGREGFTGSASEKLHALIAGLTSLGTPLSSSATPSTESDQGLGTRIDGNSMPALLWYQMRSGVEPINGQGLAIDITAAIPRVLYNDKVNTPEELRNEEGYVTLFYGLPRVDYAPTLLGILLTYRGPPLLLLFSFIFGLILAIVDLRLMTRRSLISLCAGLGLAYSIMLYEQGPNVVFVSLRAVLFLLVFLRFVSILQRVWSRTVAS